MFSNLNNSSVNVGNTATALGTGTLSFTKQYAETQIEIFFNSAIYSGSFSGATNIQYEIWVDGSASSVSTPYFSFSSGVSERVVMESIFQGLTVGAHTVTVVATTNSGASSGVVIDGGGYGGKIIVKERF